MSLSKPRRKLAAILAADVAGFSKLMGENEDQTLENLKVCRLLIDDAVKENHGRIFGGAGDSLIAEFDSPVDAVVAAVSFQKDLMTRNNKLSDNRQMLFRVGLNLGDVIIEGDNLYGDGVNVAARLEAIAEPGGITLSGKFHEEICRKLDLSFINTGQKEMKNILTPVSTFKIDIANQHATNNTKTKILGTDQPLSQVDENGGHPPAIAVLPFQNLSSDEDQEYFADGITEDIITNLSLWRTFPVISRNSSFCFKGLKKKITVISAELNAAYLVEGTVRKGGKRVRITAKLIDGKTDQHLWSKRWDRNLDDIFEVQDEVSTSIAAFISPAVKNKEIERIFKHKTKNINAWDEYLRALSYYNRSPRNIKLTQKHLNQSLNLDKGLSDSYVLLCRLKYFEIFETSDEASRNQLEEDYHLLAKKAYKLDPENPEALICLSKSMNLRKKFDERVELMEKALEINPNHSEANFEYGFSLTTFGDFEKALAFVKKGEQINPTAHHMHHALILCHIGLKNFGKALDYCETKISEQPQETRWLGWAACILGLMNRADEGQKYLKQFTSMRPEIKTLRDYEKVAPNIVKTLLLKGLENLGLPPR